jgi:hypothetical protein
MKCVQIQRIVIMLIALCTALPPHVGLGSDHDGISVGIAQNYRIHPSTVTQTEVFIVVHPSNPDVMFATANTIRFLPSLFISEGVYVTTNAGSSWYGSDSCTGQPIQFHGGDPGIAIDKNGTFIITRLGRTPFSGLYSHFSTDNGLTWSSQNTITTEDLERASVASDGDPSSSFNGRTYAAWVRFAPPYPVFMSRTDDGAANWTSPLQINNPPQRCAGGDIDIELGGKVHACWAGVTSVSPFTEVFVGYASSTDGGDNWFVLESAFSMNGIQGILMEKQNIRVNGLPRIALDNSGGPRDGWIYIITTQKNLAPAGSDPDIIVNRSTNGGVTWSSGIRVNQDLPNNGKIQYFPAIVVDDGGGVNVIYYDDRNTTSDSTGVFLSRSTDGGNTWNDFEISDHNFKPAPIGGLGQGYQGDNIDITSVNNTLWPVWMDNSTGVYQIWTAPIDITTVDITDDEVASVPRVFDLKQNYPNPFNPSTTIEYELMREDFVTLKIFDVNGEEIATLVREKQTTGIYQVKFEAESSIPSGVYFYELRVSDFSSTKAMLLVR